MCSGLKSVDPQKSPGCLRLPGLFFCYQRSRVGCLVLGCPTTVRNRVVSRSPGFGRILLQPHPAFALHPPFEDTLVLAESPESHGFFAVVSSRTFSLRSPYAFVTQAFHVVRQAVVG